MSKLQIIIQQDDDVDVRYFGLNLSTHYLKFSSKLLFILHIFHSYHSVFFSTFKTGKY